MARTQNEGTEDTGSNGSQLPVDTLASLFGEYADKFIVEAGPNNTETETGRLYRIAVPRQFTTADNVVVDMVGNASEYRSWLSNNWNGVRHGFKELDLAAKLDRASHPESNGFEPSEPAVQSPVELAAMLVIADRHSDQVAGMSVAQMAKDAEMQRTIATLLNDPAHTEAYRPLIERKLAEIANWSQERNRKGAKSETGSKFSL
jgi:hypothetical protein